jgi:hypothetical protein
MKQNRRRNGMNSMTGDMIKMGVGNIVGVGLIGASSSAVGALPAGTPELAKSMAGTAVGMQGVALLGHNVGYAKRAFGKKVKFI